MSRKSSIPLAFQELPAAKSKILQLREVAMMMLMDSITDKPNWQDKVFDEAIVEKWRKEAAEQPEESLYKRIIEGKEERERDPDDGSYIRRPPPRLVQPSKIITTKAFEYCIQELRNKAKYFRETGIVQTLDSTSYCVVKSDTLFDGELRSQLGKAFDILRADQAASVDWHPNSNDMVQDLVHPSMYPFIYGKTPFMNQELVGLQNATGMIGRGTPVAGPVDEEGNKRGYGVGSSAISPGLWSEKFQWLPSNVSFQDDKMVKISSYVNNLHPVKYQGIYQTIEKAIQTAIPLWDQCLLECDNGGGLTPARCNWRFTGIDEADDNDNTLWSDFDLEYYLTADIPLSKGDEHDLQRYFPGPDYFFQAVEAYEERKTGKPYETTRSQDELARDPKALLPEKRAYYKWLAAREPVLPEPRRFAEIDYALEESIRDVYAQDGLQIIVKMASIELTPEKPEFPAGGWHLEGMMNEKIVATALFYIDSENIKDSHIAFRAQTDSYLGDDIQTGQNAYNWLERVHGTCFGEDRAQCWQPYGDVKTPQGRVLAFPNTLQHRVSPFKLQDPTKPGHRRFLALWLVDPHVRVISTANVPPQQKEWWAAENGGGAAAEPPAGLMTREEACEERLALMEERGLGQRALEDHWNSAQYAFCEH
ncbi:hypothetical protein NLG97_g5475 [Lecanicillium saksenae]|uniref:Uncharacterized protein n=1 Tax=Lecanicillium saksenae TaxID=468837 RepID=A0ACC1QU36_9HYPO|nr:hypothetical protein NLG97_g5475 [Lecanicillium saksenae]